MMMKPMMTIEGIAERSAEMWRTGETSRQIVDYVLKSVGGLQGDTPLREAAANTFCADFFHPFNLSNVNVNLIRRLCSAIHRIGRRKFASYRFVLENRMLFPREVRTAVWIDYARINLAADSNVLIDWVTPYLQLCCALRSPGYELVRNINPMILGMTSRSYYQSGKLDAALRADSVSEFELLRTVEGLKFIKAWMRDHLQKEMAPNIMENLILNEPSIFKAFPAKEMMFYVCSSCRSATKAAKLVRALESVSPGCVTAVDVNGMTPLDYTTFRVRNMADDLPFYNESSPREIEQMLVYLGCDPKHENKYGISWADVHSQMPNMDRASKEWGDKPSRGLAKLRRNVV
mgnify:CR=1 FL=1